MPTASYSSSSAAMTDDDSERYDMYDEWEPPVRSRKHAALGGSLAGINARLANRQNGANKRVASYAARGILPSR